MFNRLKGAIDYVDQRFQEEQARAKAAQNQLARSASTARKSEGRNATSRSRSESLDRRQKDTASKSSDPNEFDPDVVTADDLEPSQTSTLGASKGNVDTQTTEAGHSSASAETKSLELSQEIRVKLRKLERLESKYQELLRSYRIAHARVTVIEPFEAALRENTPLTSINDPSALVEYLGQINTKGDMVLVELKRVTTERNVFEAKLNVAEEDARKAWDEVTKLKLQEGGDSPPASSQGTVATELDLNTKTTDLSASEVSSTQLGAMISQSSNNNSFHSTERSDGISFGNNGLSGIDSALEKSKEEVTALQEKVTWLTNELKIAQDNDTSKTRTIEEANEQLIRLRNSQQEVERLMTELEQADTRYRTLDRTKTSEMETMTVRYERRLKEVEDELQILRDRDSDASDSTKLIEDLRSQLDQLHQELEHERSQGRLRQAELMKRLEDCAKDLARAEEQIASTSEEKRGLENFIQASQNRTEVAATSAENGQPDADDDTKEKVENEAMKSNHEKKNKKKKKKGGKNVVTEKTIVSTVDNAKKAALGEPPVLLYSTEKQLEIAHAELGEKEFLIGQLQQKLKEQDAQQEEIDLLRDDLLDKGQDLVEAKKKIKELEIEKAELAEAIKQLDKDLQKSRELYQSSKTDAASDREDLAAQFEDLKVKAKSLETDLIVAQQLASSRFKDLSDLRNNMQRTQSEMRSLRTNSQELDKVKKELDERIAALGQLQNKYDGVQSQVEDLKKSNSDRSKEIGTVNTKLSTETGIRQRVETEYRKLKGDLLSAQSEAKNASQALERVSGELSQARQAVRRHESRIREMETKLGSAEQEGVKLRDDMELKSAQYVSIESLMNSMRDEASEMATQLRESRERCESLDEEVADAHRLLSERTSEGETMRRLLAEVEVRTDSRVRELRDRMNVAIEERERTEYEASASSRKRGREAEEAKTKLRETEHALRLAQVAQEELESTQIEWKRRREELEQFVERNKAETEEAKTAMSHMRDVLDASEKQTRDLEKQKADLRRSFEDGKSQIDALEKQNKALVEEIKSLQNKQRALSFPSQSGAASTTSKAPATAQRRDSSRSTEQPISQTTYLKSILLQFLEMKEKKHQVQFVPTLATLLQLDSADQQKWTAAIMAK